MTVTTEHTPGWPWPTRADVTHGVERYFQFLQLQGDYNRQLAISWVAAVVPTSLAVRGHTQSTRHPTAGHRDLAEHAQAGVDMIADPAGHEPTERAAGQNLRRNELFDSLFDGLIDADILAATR
jgi:hypothetical protein